MDLMKEKWGRSQLSFYLRNDFKARQSLQYRLIAFFFISCLSSWRNPYLFNSQHQKYKTVFKKQEPTFFFCLRHKNSLKFHLIAFHFNFERISLFIAYAYNFFFSLIKFQHKINKQMEWNENFKKSKTITMSFSFISCAMCSHIHKAIL